MTKHYYDSVINIPNGSFIGIKNGRYDFLYRNKVILADCDNFSYIAGKIVAFKKENKVIVFSMHIVNEGNNKTVEKLLEFSSFSKVAYGKIICERNSYLIDSNCQIKYSERSHIN